MELPGYQNLAPLHQTQRTTVYRGSAADGTCVVVKTPTAPNPSPREIARYQWAFDLSREADPRSVVRHREIVPHGASVAIVMDDAGGETLAALLPPGGLPLTRWLEIGAGLATALGRLHASGLIHKDLNPHNAVRVPDIGEIRLIDLGLATRFRRPTDTAPERFAIEGTLAYMSPEQCGRVASPVDNRSDLYSLGVTLFQLAAGRLPFEFATPAEIAHAHVARAVPPLRELRRDYPQAVCDIVARLMAKNADDRYASAQGLAHDLGECVTELRRSGTVRAFALGQRDASSSFRIPDRLYGRDAERTRLLDAVAQAASGARVVVTVAGASGIGKTALVTALQRGRTALQGRVGSGKFDQFGAALPYLALLQALRSLLRRELAEPEAQLASRRVALREALGPHGQLLTTSLPELHALVGPQPDVAEVPPRDAERRLHLVVGRLLAVFATRDAPLLLFLDDMQWADPPSRQLLEALAVDPGLAHLVLVAGYRTNEVGAGHPLHATLEALRGNAKVVVDIALGPLLPRDVAELLADTLHTDTPSVQSLAAHIHGVSAGNPFFVGEFVHALRERGFFHYDDARHAWVWELAQLAGFKVPDNVAALVTDRLHGLPADCLDLLDSAACVGSEFDLQTLASVQRARPSAAALGLAPAVRSGVIVPLDAQHAVFESLAGWPLSDAATAELGNARYRFQHDRVRQTVHERLDAARRAERHLRIGRLLIRHLAPAELDARVVEVFMHVVFGAALLTDPAERRRLAALGLVAGTRAQRGLAFESARRMLRTSAELLSPTAWDDDHDTAIGVHLALSQCAHALGLADEFEQVSSVVIERARSVEQRAEGHGLRIRVRHTQNRYAEAVDIGVDVAGSLGVKLPRKPRLAHVLLGVVQALGAQRTRDALSFAELGEADDPKIRSAVSLLCSIASPAYFAEPNLLPLIGMTCTRLSIRHGMTPQSPYGFAVWALVLCGVLGRIDNGYRFGQLALDVGRRYGGADEARARFVVDVFIKHWKEPLPDVARLLHADWARSRDSGDAESATYCAGVLLYTHFLAGGSIDVEARYAESIRYLVDCEQTQVKDCFLAWVELLSALRRPELPAELDGGWFSYTRLLPEFEASSNAVQVAISSAAAGVLDFFAGRHDRAEARFALAARWEDNIVGQVLVPGLAFFRALNAYRRVAAGAHDPAALRVARRQRARLRRWAAFAPFNLDHRVALLDAEDAAVRGHPAEAAMLLHTAIERAAGIAPLYEALAYQRLGSIHRAAGAGHSAAVAARQAADAYRRWGAPALAAAVDAPLSATRHGASVGKPGITSGITSSFTSSITGSFTGTSTSSDSSTDNSGRLESADLDSLFSAVAAISSEIDETALLGRLMPTLMQAAGADRGLLLLLDAHGALWVEAEASLDGTQSHRTPLDGYTAISRRAVDLALRSVRPVVVQDAAAADLLEGEAHAPASGVAAILAMSIALQGRTLGVLYFENHVARGAFTPKRVEVTLALGAQAGIALENARLYGRVQGALEAQTVLAAANRRFVPHEFVSGLGFTSIVDVQLNEAIEREMNVLFVDLRGFTALSMSLGPRAMIGMINRYLSHVQPGIAAHGGFVGQYYGDGLLALFPNDAEDALRGAIAMCRGLEGYNRERGALPELRFGMGLHSGPLTLGTIGDPDHFQCGVVGDSVNLASRMEGLTKHFGATLVVSGATQARVRSPETFGLRPLGRVEAAGRSEPLDVFECVACYADAVQERLRLATDTYREALAAYRAGHWAEGLTAFEACVAACNDDAVARAFAQRCRERVGAGRAWDGIERPAKG